MPSGVIQVFERPIYAEVAAVGPQGAAGPPGVDGLPGPPGQSAILGTWEGTWIGERRSTPRCTWFSIEGSTYLNAGQSNTAPPPGLEPPAPPWELVAAKGDGACSRSSTSTINSLPSAVWTVAHGLGGFPNVTAIDSADSEIVGDLLYIDNNTVQITFASGTDRKGLLS